MLGRFEWYFDFNIIPDLLHPSWYTWVRLRLRKATTKEQYDFLSVGAFLNAPQIGALKRLFTGISVGLFEWQQHIGYWRPISSYRLRSVGATTRV